ncbi:MAG: acetolactate synthase [Xanthomonadaceae bacterium]|jgi:acetolactate synthase II small subunit|nr:acetolactate synthase [Xanthomonadaceae bacterium]
MRYQLDLVLRPVEGALVRIIGMVERRGFGARAITGDIQSVDGRWHLKLVVEGQRPIEALHRQLEKIYDCLSVRIIPIEAVSETAT